MGRGGAVQRDEGRVLSAPRVSLIRKERSDYAQGFDLRFHLRQLVFFQPENFVSALMNQTLGRSKINSLCAVDTTLARVPSRKNFTRRRTYFLTRTEITQARRSKSMGLSRINSYRLQERHTTIRRSRITGDKPHQFLRIRLDRCLVAQLPPVLFVFFHHFPSRVRVGKRAIPNR
jgi:hypothetical protein